MSRMIKQEDIEVYESSGNVFADLGFDEPEEELAKAKLAIQIGRIIRERGWNQMQAAQVMGVDQPKVSKIVRGRLGPFSTERLMHYLTQLGQDIEIVVRPKAAEQSKATLRVSVIEELMAAD